MRLRAARRDADAARGVYRETDELRYETVARNNRYGAARKKKRNSLFAPVSFLLVALAILFGMGVFFRVQVIEVVGAETYTDEQIIEASGVAYGDNLFFINRISASSRIFSNLPFVKEASIERVLPNKLVVTVSESCAAAYADWNDQHWMMTASCKYLGTGDGATLSGLIRILNLEIVDPKAGEQVTVNVSDSIKLSYLETLLRAFEEADMIGDVDDLDLSNPANPTFRYLGRFTVKMGPNENTDYKLRMLMSAVTQMDGSMTGSIDLSEGTAVRVSPE